MKTSTFALVAGASSAIANPFFVLYGTDTVVQRADPIISPGKLSQHVHDFAGSDYVAAELTYQDLQDHTTCTSVGNAAGHPINEDRSVYWHPALFVKNNASELVRVPVSGRQIYYKDAGVEGPNTIKRDPFEFPKGFRMIAGDPSRRTANLDTSSGTTNMDNIGEWWCHGGVGIGVQGAFPKDVVKCDAYPGYNARITFPHCWNGKDFDQANPTAHMSYPTGDMENGVCPDSHNIRVPQIMMENNFEPDHVEGGFESNTFTLAQGDATGFGLHADFFNGWVEGALASMLSGDKNCGETHDVGDCPTATFNTAMDKSKCVAKVIFDEDVDGPMKALPGCNPITTVASPMLATCPLGTKDGSGSSAGDSSSSVSSSSAAAYSTASSVAASSATSASPVTSASSYAPSSSVNPAPSSSSESSIETSAASALPTTYAAVGSSQISSGAESTTTPVVADSSAASSADASVATSAASSVDDVVTEYATDVATATVVRTVRGHRHAHAHPTRRAFRR